MMDRILCFDIGGTAVKAMLFDESGKAHCERMRIPTPRPATPKAVLGVMASISKLASIQRKFDRVSAGFPGVVKGGVVFDAPNLSPDWKDLSLQEALENLFRVPVRVANDADTQGLGASRGRGLELTITLGTGVGSALVYNGMLVPNLELGHHPSRHGETYEEQLGKSALDTVGRRRWNIRVRKMVKNLATAFNFDELYIGGGNAKHVVERLPGNVHLISNEYGLLGGVKLWYPRVKIKELFLKVA